MSVLEVAPSGGPVRKFDRGWVMEDGSRTAFLSYASRDTQVNWSDELEALHEESSRTHFMDVMTRMAIIARLRPSRAPLTIGDLGCSTGHLLADLNVAFPDAILFGVDLVRPGLVKAHELVPDARLLCADVCNLPIAEASIDAICSANLLEHIPDDRAALREMARVLKPGGRAVIVVPAGPSTYDYYDRFLGHERRYAARELAGKARAAGFEVLDDAHLGSLIFPAFWLVKQRNRRRYGHLAGAALERRVAQDIAGTNNSRLGHLSCVIERRLLSRRIRLPFGIRNIVSLRRC